MVWLLATDPMDPTTRVSRVPCVNVKATLVISEAETTTRPGTRRVLPLRLGRQSVPLAVPVWPVYIVALDLIANGKSFPFR